MFGLQRRLVYFPAGPPPPVQQVLPDATAVTISTADGLQLSAWHLPGGPVGVVVLPGNAGNRAGRAPLAAALGRLGLSVLLVDYRGYGGNPGTPGEVGLITDGTAAASWLAGRSEVQHIVYLGESIGAAVALGVAVDHPPAALVLRSPFTSLTDVARLHYGPVPDWLVRDRFDSLDRIRRIDVPLLVVTGADDTIVPPAHSRRLLAAAGEPKRYVAVPGAGHNDRVLLDGAPFVEAIGDFLRDQGLIAH